MLFVLWNERFCTISNVVSLRNLSQIILSLIINHVNISNQPICRYNYSNTQLQSHCANISMNVSTIMNALMVQLGTSCSFDSPGLARNEPTPGEHPQGDSTPSVLSFFFEGTLTMKLFMADYSKKAQHLRRWSPHNIR